MAKRDSLTNMSGVFCAGVQYSLVRMHRTLKSISVRRKTMNVNDLIDKLADVLRENFSDRELNFILDHFTIDYYEEALQLTADDPDSYYVERR